MRGSRKIDGEGLRRAMGGPRALPVCYRVFLNRLDHHKTRRGGGRGPQKRWGGENGKGTRGRERRTMRGRHLTM
jgi:hypothetical protein